MGTVECGIVVFVNARIRRAVTILALAAIASGSGQITWAQPQAPAQSSLALLAGPLYQQLATLKGMTRAQMLETLRADIEVQIRRAEAIRRK